MKYILIALSIALLVGAVGVLKLQHPQETDVNSSVANQLEDEGGPFEQLNPLSIASLRNGNYPGSDLRVEETLASGSNYQRYIVSYLSEGHKIYALLTIPNGTKPASGWPVVIFNHGYIPPAQYRTTERYVAYVDGFARSGYIVLRSDYRGHGNSEGVAQGGYGNNDYTIDILNAVASIKKHPDADVNRIGMWGHSMGGHITLRAMVVNPEIKAGVIWGGVVASYPDLISRWRRGNRPSPTPATSLTPSRRWRQLLVEQFGDPTSNPDFWNSISANTYLADLGGPIQLHHGVLDESVPVEFSEILHQQMKDAGKVSGLFTYPGDDHDITTNFGTAMRRSIAFFDEHVKNLK